ncbi:MAG: AAA family ATPase [Chlamydiae bacterium]|nr:AAA family ATPase [Chlamydiota bacterium]
MTPISGITNTSPCLSQFKAKENIQDNNQTTLWQKISNVWFFSNPLKVKLSNIEAKIGHFTEEEFDSLAQLIQDIAKNKDRFCYKNTFKHLKTLLSSLDNASLDKLVFKTLQKQLLTKDPSILDCLLDLLSFSQIQSLIFLKNKESKDLIKDLESVKKYAAKVAEFTQTPTDKNNQDSMAKKSSILAKISNILNSLWDTLKKSSDFETDSPTPQTRQDAQDKLKTLYLVVLIPAIIFKFLFDYLSNLSVIWWVPYLGTSGVFLILVALAKIYGKIAPSTPKNLSYEYINLTTEAKENKISPIIGRKEEIAKIVRSLGKMDRSSQFPLLIGPVGIGKSTIIKGLAREINEGQIPSLKGKELYVVNTSYLIEQGANNLFRLEVILNHIKESKQDVIIVFDQAHILLNLKADNDFVALANKFPTLMDSGKIHFIGITTQEAYEKTIKTDPELNSRFDVMQIQELSRNEIVLALRSYLSEEFPEIEISDEALQKIIELSQNDPNEATISIAKKLLYKAATSIKFYQSKESATLQEKQEELQRLKTEYSHLSSFLQKNGQPLFASMEALKVEIQKLKSIVKVKNKHFDELSNLRKEHNNLEDRYVSLASKLQNIDSKNPQFLKTAKVFLIVQNYLIEISKNILQAQKDEVAKDGQELAITKSLIEKIHQDEVLATAKTTETKSKLWNPFHFLYKKIIYTQTI